MQLITDIEQEQEIVDCWVDLITYMKSVPFAPPLSKSNLYSAPLEEQEKIDHKSTKLPKLHLLSFHSSVFFFLSIFSLSPSWTAPLSLSPPFYLALPPFHPSAVMKIDVQALISICFGMHTASLSIPDPPIS